MRRLVVLAVSLLSGLLMATPAMAATPAPLGGGSSLYSLTGPSGSACTAGFAATTASGGWVLIAAGPGCGAAGTTLYSGANVVVGTVGSRTPDGLAIVSVTNHTDWTLVPWVGHGDPFTASTAPRVGAPVCLIGADDSSRCGEITAVDVTVVFEGGVVTGLAATSVVPDRTWSAVTFVSGTDAEGVLIGSSTATSYFHPITDVLSQYGLNLLV